MNCPDCGKPIREMETERDGRVPMDSKAVPYEYADWLMPDRLYTEDGRRIRGMRTMPRNIFDRRGKADGYGYRPHYCKGREA